MIRETTAAIPATATKRADRSWSAEFAGLIAYGPTLAAARASLSELIVRAVKHTSERPAFARDDDGTFVVVVPDGIGSAEWRVSDAAGARLTGHSDGTPEGLVARVHHFTPIAYR